VFVLTLASQKGGSGKTTLAAHLAIAAESMLAGRVTLIDADPQGSLSQWWNARDAATPLFARCRIAELGRDLERLSDAGMALVVIDTPPAILETVVEIIRQSDLVVVPVQPSPHDLRAAAATVAFVERLGKPFLFVLNGAVPRSRLTTEAAALLAERGPLAPVMIPHRTGFAASMIDGRSVMEVHDDGSAGEIARLWDYINARFNRAPHLVLPSDRWGDGAALSPA